MEKIKKLSVADLDREGITFMNIDYQVKEINDNWIKENEDYSSFFIEWNSLGVVINVWGMFGIVPDLTKPVYECTLVF